MTKEQKNACLALFDKYLFAIDGALARKIDREKELKECHTLLVAFTTELGVILYGKQD